MLFSVSLHGMDFLRPKDHLANRKTHSFLLFPPAYIP
jgi:hypothetical protein